MPTRRPPARAALPARPAADFLRLARRFPSTDALPCAGCGAPPGGACAGSVFCADRVAAHGAAHGPTFHTFALSDACVRAVGATDPGLVGAAYPTLEAVGRDRYRAAPYDLCILLSDLAERGSPDSGFEEPEPTRRACTAAVRRLQPLVTD